MFTEEEKTQHHAACDAFIAAVATDARLIEEWRMAQPEITGSAMLVIMFKTTSDGSTTISIRSTIDDLDTTQTLVAEALHQLMFGEVTEHEAMTG